MEIILITIWGFVLCAFAALLIWGYASGSMNKAQLLGSVACILILLMTASMVWSISSAISCGKPCPVKPDYSHYKQAQYSINKIYGGEADAKERVGAPKKIEKAV